MPTRRPKRLGRSPRPSSPCTRRGHAPRVLAGLSSAQPDAWRSRCRTRRPPACRAERCCSAASRPPIPRARRSSSSGLPPTARADGFRPPCTTRRPCASAVRSTCSAAAPARAPRATRSCASRSPALTPRWSRICRRRALTSRQPRSAAPPMSSAASRAAAGSTRSSPGGRGHRRGSSLICRSRCATRPSPPSAAAS